MHHFWYVLLAHLLYDFHWQGPFIAENKGKRPFLLAVHALTWALCLCAVLQWTGAFALWKFAFLFVTHLAVDAWKSRKPKDDAHWHLIYIDQAAHLLTILVVL